jgi:ribosomal protein L3 glutamine methyltransferase
LSKLSDHLAWAEKLFIQHELFFGHGTASAWDEAVFIASYVLDLDLYQVDLPDQDLTKKQINLFKKIVNKRITTKQPLPYIINTAWFAGKKYYIDHNAIIPRSPLAELINNEFKPWLKQPPTSVLDLCTGSGCIAIACHHELQQIYNNKIKFKITASDVSLSALKIAQKNLALHNISTVTLIKSDLFARIPEYQYDLILSNPPYVDQKTFDNLPEEFHYEPKLALVSGKTGLEIVIKILQQASNYLANNGILIVEVGYLWEKLVRLYPQVNFTWLDFEFGGEGVFLLTKQQLIKYFSQD